MPTFLQIASVDPELGSLSPALRSVVEEHYPSITDDLLTWQDLNDALLAIARAAPSLDLRVVYDGQMAPFDLHATGVHDGGVWQERFSLSMSRDENVPGPKKFARDEPIALDVDADRLVDLVNHSAGDPGTCHGEGQMLTLPFDFVAPLNALATVAGHLEREREEFVIGFDGAFYAGELHRKKDVTLRGLWVWHDDPVLRAAGRNAVSSPRDDVLARAAMAAPEITPWDPLRPLVTGSAEKRETAAFEMMPSFTRTESSVGYNPFVKPTSPELMETLMTAAKDSANVGPAFANVRRELYGHLAEFTAIEAGRALMSFVEREENDPELRLVLYGHIAKRRGKNPGRFLVQAYRREQALRSRIGEVLWKHEAAIEMLVRDELVPAWRGDPEYAKEIVRLLKREMIPVPAEWIAGDADLTKALGRLVRFS